MAMSAKRHHTDAFGPASADPLPCTSHTLIAQDDRPKCKPHPRKPTILSSWMARLYYDPYQRAEVSQDGMWTSGPMHRYPQQAMWNEKHSYDDDGLQERSPKRFKSLASVIVNGLVRGLAYGPSVAVSACKHLWYELDPSAGRRAYRARTKTIDVAAFCQTGVNLHLYIKPYPMATSTADDAWGLVSKGDYQVNFLPPPTSTSNSLMTTSSRLPPPKPKRTFKNIMS